MVGRWAARLSAALVRGNAAVLAAAGLQLPEPARPEPPGASGLPHLLPEGDSAYELLVGRGLAGPL